MGKIKIFHLKNAIAELLQFEIIICTRIMYEFCGCICHVESYYCTACLLRSRPPSAAGHHKQVAV
jgi:hypothetical protein